MGEVAAVRPVVRLVAPSEEGPAPGAVEAARPPQGARAELPGRPALAAQEARRGRGEVED